MILAKTLKNTKWILQNTVYEPVGYCCKSFFRLNVPGTKDISIPTDVTNENIKKKLNEKMKHGSYLTGNLIVPQSFKRVILRDNTIIVDEVVVHGRKIPMTEIRKKMFKDHNPYMRLRSDEDFEKLTREELTNNYMI